VASAIARPAPAAPAVVKPPPATKPDAPVSKPSASKPAAPKLQKLAAVAAGGALQSIAALFGPAPAPRALPASAFDPNLQRYDFHPGERNTNVALESSSSPSVPLRASRRGPLSASLAPVHMVPIAPFVPPPTPTVTPPTPTPVAPERSTPSSFTPMQITPLPAEPSAVAKAAAQRAKAEAMARRRKVSLLHGAFQHWRQVASAIAEEREWQQQLYEEQLQREEDFRHRVGSDLLRPHELVPPGRVKALPQPLALSAPSGSELSANEQLERIQQEREKVRLTMLEPMDLPRVLLPHLKRTSPQSPNLFWKVEIEMRRFFQSITYRFSSSWLYLPKKAKKVILEPRGYSRS
jgi:hypothetical protein